MTHSSFTKQVSFIMRVLRLDLLIGLLLLSLHSPFTFASSIQVEVQGLTPAKGQVICNLFDSEESFLETPLRTAIQAIEGNTNVRLKFEEVMPNTYAVACIHDKNKDGELDRNFMGLPKEAVGASNNAKSMFGPPKYEDAKFEVSEEEPLVRMQIKVEYIFD